MNGKETKGVALIVGLVMVLLFLAIIMAVVLTSTVSVRLASYSQDRFIALQIAEAGIQDCLYWMNYRGYWNHYYPSHYAYPRAYFRGSDYSEADTWVAQEVSFRPAGFSLGRCQLFFEDKEGIDQDRIVSTGYYRGRTGTLEVTLRGFNGLDNPAHASSLFLCDWNGTDSMVATWGIPEIFNKHAIYARVISSASGQVEGNITYKDPEGIDLSGLTGRHTLTRDRIMTTIPPWNYFPSLIFPNMPSVGSFAQQFINETDQHGYRWDSDYRYGPVDGIGHVWHFGDTGDTPPGQLIDQSIRLEWAGTDSGRLRITEENNGRIFASYVLVADGDIFFETSFTVSTQKAAFVSRDGFYFSPGITIKCVNSGWLALDRMSPGGVTIENVTIRDGPLLTGSGVTNLTLIGCILDASDGETALVVKSGTVNLRNCTVKGRVMGEGAGRLTLDNTRVEARFSQGKSTAAIVSKGPLSMVNNSQVKGLVLVLSDVGSNDCYLSSGKVEGVLGVKGELNLIGSSISYLGELHRNRSDIFQPFIGGRRIYLPVSGSWRIY
ncbi:MAG: pilus assembly PilX N-terminal domain-containing protein [Candidatus Omnitrophica bacterium]|nr:pilus assembly PilX N-terminal domain-containing protein [Candidatus Omnitrophota bacterium]